MAREPLDFGKNLRFARERKQWTQKTLAGTIGIGYYNVSNWETRGVVPSLDLIVLLEKALEVTGLLLLHSEFLTQNDLYDTYPGMEYFPIVADNAETYGIFEGKLFERLAEVTQSLHYTRLCEFDRREGELVTDRDPQFTPRELQSDTFREKLLNGRVTWERAEIFYSLGRLEQALKSLILLRGTRYEIRFYLASPKSFPIINLRSFDHRKFLIGGYDPERVYHNNCVALGDKEPLRDFLEKYWHAVWVVGRPERLTFRTADLIVKSLDVLSDEEWQHRKARIFAETKPLNEKLDLSSG